MNPMRFSSVCILFLLAVYLLNAQDRASIIGTVTDPSGAVVQDSKIDLKSLATGLHLKASTNEVVLGYCSGRTTTAAKSGEVDSRRHSTPNSQHISIAKSDHNFIQKLHQKAVPNLYSR